MTALTEIEQCAICSKSELLQHHHQHLPAQACKHVLIGRSPHDTQLISKAVRSYLNMEWQHQLDDKVSRSVPLVWAEEHPGMSPYYGRHTMPGVVADVPSQNNGYDCGLFVLTYMDFWTYSPPDQVNFSDEGKLKGKHLCFCYACTLADLLSALYRCMLEVHLGSINSHGMRASGTTLIFVHC